MPKLVVDLTKVTELIEPGTYDAVVHSVESREFSTGNSGLAVAFRIEHADYPGRKVFRNFTFTDDSMVFFKRFLVACGFDKTSLEESEIELDTDELIGVPVKLRINHRQWEGEAQNNVQRVLPPTAEVAELASLL